MLLFGSHLLSWSRYGIAGLSSSRARKRFMRIVRRPAEPVMNGRAFGRPRRIVVVRADPSLLPAGAGSILSAARAAKRLARCHPSTTLDVAVEDGAEAPRRLVKPLAPMLSPMPSQGPAADPEARDSSCLVAFLLRRNKTVDKRVSFRIIRSMLHCNIRTQGSDARC